MGRKRLTAPVISGAAFVFLFPVLALSQTPFYQGKTITIISGRGPGGVGDLRVRAVTARLTKYIPGNPAVVVEFMPGAGGRKAANYIYRRARPDGLTIANVGGGVVQNAVLGETGIEYDLDRLIYLGSPNSVTYYLFATNSTLGLNTIEKLRAYSGLRIGAQSVGHDGYIRGRLFAYFLDLKEPKFITGYTGPEITVAMARGELDAFGGTAAETVERVRPDWVHKGVVNFHAVINIPKEARHPLFGHLPDIETFARSEKERRLLAMSRTLRLVGSPYILPPGTPKDRVEILAEAMRRTFKDPEFRKEFTKLLGAEASPLMPEEQTKAIRELPREPETVDFFKSVAGAGPLPPRE